MNAGYPLSVTMQPSLFANSAELSSSTFWQKDSRTTVTVDCSTPCHQTRFGSKFGSMGHCASLVRLKKMSPDQWQRQLSIHTSVALGMRTELAYQISLQGGGICWKGRMEAVIRGSVGLTSHGPPTTPFAFTGPIIDYLCLTPHSRPD
jgi:hypothetical protein